MIEYRDIIYLDVYRTGSTHTIRLLDQICVEEPVRKFRHSSLTKGRPFGLAGGKHVVTSVRNPWDWYVSLWAFGADGKSGPRRYLKAHLSADELAALYDRSNAIESFHRWLHVIHDPSVLDTVMKEHLPQSGLARVAGLYTYRFLRVTTRYPRFLLRYPFIRSPADAAPYHRLLRAYDTVLRNETLNEDLIALVERIPHAFCENAVDIIRATGRRRPNASRRTLASYRDYYSDSDAALVADRDQFFMGEFGYRF